MIWATIFGGLFDVVKDYLKRRKEIIDVKHETKIKQITAQQEWENKAVDGMASSWKDELWTIWFVILLTACFIPGARPYIEEGFYTLSVSTPWWIEYALLASIGASLPRSITEGMITSLTKILGRWQKTWLTDGSLSVKIHKGFRGIADG